MRSATVGSLLKQLRNPPQSIPAGISRTPPPFARVELTGQGKSGSTCGRHDWAGRFRMTSLAGEPPCTSSEVYKAVEEHLGRLSTAPSVPPLQPVKLVISGPSGVGKDAVIKALQASRPNLHFVVTATSRPKRPGEADGMDYFFVSKEQFEDWIRCGELLEWALVYGDYKGIPKRQVEEALTHGTDVVFRLDIQGAHTIRRTFPDAVSIFLVAESEAVLACRLIARKTEPLDKMIMRVKTAHQEMRHLRDFDYVVVNRDGDLEGAVRQIDDIISAERHRISRLQWQDGQEAAGSAEQQLRSAAALTAAAAEAAPPCAAAAASAAARPELQKC